MHMNKKFCLYFCMLALVWVAFFVSLSLLCVCMLVCDHTEIKEDPILFCFWQICTALDKFLCVFHHLRDNFSVGVGRGLLAQGKQLQMVTQP